MGLRSAIAERFGRGDSSADSTAEHDEPTVTSMVELAEEIAANPRTVEVRDGRQIGYADVGDPDGDPLFVFHGFPNSRVFGALFDEVGREVGVRVIAPERPGFGVSDPDPDRALTDWPDDLADVADALDVDSFSVLGVSGGGPYAAVSAALLPDRVEHAGIAVGLAPMASVGIRDRLWYYAARFVPPVSKLLVYLVVKRALGSREEFQEYMADQSSPADEALWNGETGATIHASIVESRRVHGIDPLVRETALYGSPYGFDLEDIEVPVHLWYGKADILVPPAMGLYYAEKIPTAEAHVYPELDHLSTVEENEREIIRTLTGRDP